MGAVHKLAAAITPGGAGRGWGTPPWVWGAPDLGKRWILGADPDDAERSFRGLLSRVRWFVCAGQRGKAGKAAVRKQQRKCLARAPGRGARGAVVVGRCLGTGSRGSTRASA